MIVFILFILFFADHLPLSTVNPVKQTTSERDGTNFCNGTICVGLICFARPQPCPTATSSPILPYPGQEPSTSIEDIRTSSVQASTIIPATTPIMPTCCTCPGNHINHRIRTIKEVSLRYIKWHYFCIAHVVLRIPFT